ncbi:FAD-binding domain-containing protein [Dothidotthia symphoricarpi CBS 119687]|uniref:FAD-binding domain-containing protein n=1 Tax=Dothidotthia symphoricarpi CBS 119687 TaxID=1392245 RepID=A0A6A6A4V3_9PLEO|nr:FAD-binding domain-containing protein [Dothidotthia symphoricarpi CBS 119687]KAF2126566.1 FAD-binding domain-containing protein [Dothidotthia symphoricarpi CBS 119687]
MASNERVPLLDEKSQHADQVGSQDSAAIPHSSHGHRRHSRLAWAILLPLFCIATILGISSLYTIQHSRSSNWSGSRHTPVDERPATTSNYTCVPGQTCWPSTSQWSAFNQSINGHLRLTIPWAAPCYSNSTSKECQEVSKDYMDGTPRSAHYGSMEFLDWETCGQSNCQLNSFSPSSPVSGTCSLGRLSTYHVEAHTSDDIGKTLDFVRKHGIRVSIKNTGHDYFGRSNAANSLAIWTHKMKDAKYHKKFQPRGCKTRYENIGEIGAGIQAQEAWEFFEPLDMMVTVGAVGSVGIAGGFGQGGGHGPLGPKYGMMVDQAVEFDVVTADGKHRTINECSDPDLFWAMRGGGGGNYAVLTSYKFQLHPAVPLNVYSFQANFPTPDGDLDITESKVHRDIVQALASNQTLFSQHGMAGYNFLLPDHMVSLQILPSTNTSAIRALTAQWHDFLTTYPGLNITENKYHTFPKFSTWHTFTQRPSISRNGPVGLGLFESGRLLPAPLFQTPSSIDTLVSAVVTAMQFSLTNRSGGGVQLYATGPATHPDNSKTGLNPAWRSALWHVVMGAVWTTATPPQVRAQMQNTVSAAIQPFKALTPGGGCYVNEGDWTEENWQQAFFGSNYDRLLGVKRRYDSTGLFSCWKCVGWTGYEDPMYSCYSQSGREPRPSVPLGPVG